MVRSERLKLEVEAQGQETFDEADDFDIGDDFDPTSPYESDFDPMAAEDRAALSSQGKNVDAILGPAPKPKKNKAAGDKPASVTEPAEPAESGDA